jgi:hypothetical protein
MRHVNATSLPKQINIEKRFGQWSHTPQISHFTIMRKWKRVFVNGCTCKRMIFQTPAEIGQMQECIRGLCRKIIVGATLNIVINFALIFMTWGTLTHWTSFVIETCIVYSTRFYITINKEKTKNWLNSVVLPLTHFNQDHREIWLKAVRLQNCVRRDSSKNFENHTGNLVWGSPWFSLVPPREFWGGTRN